jgi:hypothetical protein
MQATAFPELEHGHRIHWWQIITDLMMQADMSQAEIACSVDPGTMPAWVNQLRNEVHANPTFPRGVRLVRLWEVKVADRHGYGLSRVLIKDC